MRKKKEKADNLSQAVKDEEFMQDAELAFAEAEEEAIVSSDSDDENRVISEEELKVRRARRTKFAVAAFVLLIGIGVLGNWYYENSDFSSVVKPLITSSSDEKTLGEAEYVDGPAHTESNESAYFSEARVNRQSARDEAIEKLQAIVDSSEESDAAKKSATDGLAKISSQISIENKIETLVCAKGVNNCLAVISEDGERVDVIVDVDELSDTVIMQIKEIAMQQLNVGFDKVSVIQSNK